MKRILLTGCRGQLGTALIGELNGLGELIATDRQFLDVRDSGAMRRVLLDSRPDVIVNAAAFTAVDRAESQYAEAEAVNAVAPAILANIARSIGSTLVHFSTDYVFSGSLYAPYREAHRTRPLSVYGKTKLAGEEAIRQSGCQHLIFRTGWLMSMTKPNFIQFVLDKLISGQEFPIIAQWGHRRRQHGLLALRRLLYDACSALLGSACWRQASCMRVHPAVYRAKGWLSTLPPKQLGWFRTPRIGRDASPGRWYCSLWRTTPRTCCAGLFEAAVDNASRAPAVAIRCGRHTAFRNGASRS